MLQITNNKKTDRKIKASSIAGPSSVGLFIIGKKEMKKIYDKRYLIANRDKLNKKSRTWKQKNPKKVLEQGRRYRAKYKDKLKEKWLQFRKEHPELKEKYDFMSRRSTTGVDISFDEYKKLIDEHKGICSICGKRETYKYGTGKIKQLALDHNHLTRKPRGLLCHKCNTAIGMLGDDIFLLEKAVIYLKKYNEKD